MLAEPFIGSGSQRGVTLVESLIAVVVVSVGLLGFANLQFRGLQTNQSAMSRSFATILAYDMADRMRANRAGVLAGAYNDVDTVANAETDPGCMTSNCNPTQVAEFDIFEWGTAISTALPGGRGQIEAGAAAGHLLVTVLWDDERRGASGTGCDPANDGDMKCFRVVVQP